MASGGVGRVLQRLQRYQQHNRIVFLRRCLELLDRMNPLEDLDDRQFRMRYRIDKGSVVFLLDMLIENQLLRTDQGIGFPPMIRLLIALQFLATGDSQLTMGDLYKVSQPTVSRLVTETTTAIAMLRPQFISFPSHAEAEKIRDEFFKVAGFPGIVGAIDCTHIRILQPVGELPELYRNHKDWHSINCQVVCDQHMKIQSLVAYWYGSTHDSRIFDNSRLFIRLDENLVPGSLIGDGGYPCLPFLMTPLRNPQTAAEQRYNDSHIATHNVIKHFNGVWKRIFPILQLGICLKLPTIRTVILACGVLYNLRLIQNNVALFNEDEIYEDPDALDIQQLPPARDGNIRGQNVRRQIINNFFS